MKRRTLILSVAGFSACVALAADREQQFKTRLSPVSMDARMMVNIAGRGSATAVLKGTKLSVSGTFTGLKSAATKAQLHEGRGIGVRGPASFDLTASPATDGTISGTFDLTPAQVEDLKKGRFYVQIDSEKAPEGNLWGWLLP